MPDSENARGEKCSFTPHTFLPTSSAELCVEMLSSQQDGVCTQLEGKPRVSTQLSISHGTRPARVCAFMAPGLCILSQASLNLDVSGHGMDVCCSGTVHFIILYQKYSSLAQCRELRIMLLYFGYLRRKEQQEHH